VRLDTIEQQSRADGRGADHDCRVRASPDDRPDLVAEIQEPTLRITDLGELVPHLARPVLLTPRVARQCQSILGQQDAGPDTIQTRAHPRSKVEEIHLSSAVLNYFGVTCERLEWGEGEPW
jgi:hypothetical protein